MRFSFLTIVPAPWCGYTTLSPTLNKPSSPTVRGCTRQDADGVNAPGAVVHSVSKVPQIGHFSAKCLHFADSREVLRTSRQEDRAGALRARGPFAAAEGSGFDPRRRRRGRAAPGSNRIRRLTCRRQRGAAALLSQNDRSSPPPIATLGHARRSRACPVYSGQSAQHFARAAIAANSGPRGCAPAGGGVPRGYPGPSRCRRPARPRGRAVRRGRSLPALPGRPRPARSLRLAARLPRALEHPAPAARRDGVNERVHRPRVAEQLGDPLELQQLLIAEGRKAFERIAELLG